MPEKLSLEMTSE